jgi:hypothetical protein
MLIFSQIINLCEYSFEYGKFNSGELKKSTRKVISPFKDQQSFYIDFTKSSDAKSEIYF